MSSNQDYIPMASGLSRGDQGEDVGRLQSYLAKFGYIEFDREVESGIFDDETSWALRRFQGFNHLPITGSLDDATYALIRKPRCGVSDMDKGKYKILARSGRWEKTKLTYDISLITNDLDIREVTEAISGAFLRWSSASILAFTQAANPGLLKPDIDIRFVTPGDGQGGVLAQAWSPPTGDVHFDDDELWTLDCTLPTGVDLLCVAIHEIGHALGLDHSSNPDSIMQPYYQQIACQHHLGSEDLENISRLYSYGEPEKIPPELKVPPVLSILIPEYESVILLKKSDDDIKMYPKNKWSWRRRGLVLFRSGRYAEAIQCYDTAIKIDPEEIYVLADKGNAFARLGEIEMAIQCYDKVLKVKPDVAETWINKGYVLYKSDQIEDAIISFNKAQEIEPNNMDTCFNKGVLLMSNAQYREAIDTFDKVLAINPNHTMALASKGNALAEIGKSEEAIKAYDMAIRLDPNYAKAWYNKGVALTNEAEAAFTKAKERGYKDQSKS